MPRFRSFPLKVTALVTVCFFAWTFVLPREALAAEVTVPPQTNVLVATTSTIVPKEVNVGDSINLAVVNDVVVDGRVVIKAGAMVYARVTQAKDRGMIGIPAAIGIVLESVEAVDGNMIPIAGSQNQEGKNKMVMSIGLALVCCLLFALIKGGEAIIPAGTQIHANTTMRTVIKV